MNIIDKIALTSPFEMSSDASFTSDFSEVLSACAVSIWYLLRLSGLKV